MVGIICGLLYIVKRRFLPEMKPLSGVSAIVFVMCIGLPMVLLVVVPIELGMSHQRNAVFQYAEARNKVVVDYVLCDSKGVAIGRRARPFIINWRYLVTFGKGQKEIVTIGLPLFGEFFGEVTKSVGLGSG
jgi:hypothetical protein